MESKMVTRLKEQSNVCLYGSIISFILMFVNCFISILLDNPFAFFVGGSIFLAFVIGFCVMYSYINNKLKE